MTFDFAAASVEETSKNAATSPSDPLPDRSLLQSRIPEPPSPPTAVTTPPKEQKGPRGWQPPQGAVSGGKMQKIEAVRKESIVSMLPHPRNQQPRSSNNLQPNSPGPFSAPIDHSDQRQQVCSPSPQKTQPRRKMPQEADPLKELEEQLPESLKWIVDSLQAWTGLKECMQTHLDEHSEHAHTPHGRGLPQGIRPTAHPSAGPSQRNGPPPPQAGRTTTWFARTAPGLNARDEEACGPAQLSGQREDDMKQERAICGKELVNIMRGVKASMASLKGNKNNSPNQDRAFYMGLRNTSAELLAVFDGHGECGHTVAEVSCEVLPKLLLRSLAQVGALPGVAGHPDARPTDLRPIACRAFEEMHSMVELLTCATVNAEKEPNQVDGRSSGTTGTAVLVLPGRRLLVSHVGDSRAVFGRRRKGRTLDDYGPWNMVELTRDHKPDLPDEKQRIEASGAKIVTVGNESLSVVRVYSSQQTWPSINMSRSIGDLHSHTQGLSATAEVNMMERLWDPEAEEAVLILASDGVWDVMDPTMAAECACQELLNGNDPAAGLCADAADRWVRRGLPGNYSDDITAVVKFL